MKKNVQKTTFDNLQIISKNKTINNNVKTTNVNILLNRVRLDQKRNLKKKIIFSLFLLSVIGTLAIYFTI